MTDQFYTIEQVAERWGCNARFIRDKVGASLLKAYKIGHRILFLHSDLVEFIKANPHTPSPKNKPKKTA